jgi:hypothetical protein
MIPSPGSLAQQILANAPVPGVTAFTAHQLTEAALRSHDTFTGRLLEQAPGQVLDAGAFSETRVVEQPLSDPH